jgi:hypothetical protein
MLRNISDESVSPRPRSAPAPSLPPISITNVVPSQLHESSSSVANGIAMTARKRSEDLDLDIHSPRGAAVIAYSKWQQSNIMDEVLKDEFWKACDATLGNGLDL